MAAEPLSTVDQFSKAAQGFLIGRPLEEKDFLAWWKAQGAETRGVELQPDMWQPEGSD